MKLLHIFWSLLILCATIIIIRLIFPTSGPFGGGLNLYAFILITWCLVTLLSPILLILRKLRMVNAYEKLWIAFLFVLNLFFGILVASELIIGNIQESRSVALILSTLNFVWALIIFISTLKRPEGLESTYSNQKN
jgi:hypothetical protein